MDTDSLGKLVELFIFNFAEVDLVAGFLDILLVEVFQFDIAFHLVLDLLVLVGKGPPQHVDFVFLLVDVVADPSVLLLVLLQLIFQDQIFFSHFVHEGLGLHDFAGDVGHPGFIIPYGFAQLLDLVDGIVL